MNSTITLNTDTLGAFAINDSAGGSSDTINNSIVAGNAGGDLIGLNGASNIIGNGEGTNFVNGVNGNIVGTAANPIDPRLSSLRNYGGPTPTHGLLANSPALNSGDNSLAVDAETNQPLTSDQRGMLRLFQGLAAAAVVDIGAFELQTPTANGVRLGGRVMDANGNGATNAIVTLTGSDGLVRWTRTTAFGYYSFADLPVGGIFLISIDDRRHTFEPRAITLTGDLSDVNFVASDH